MVNTDIILIMCPPFDTQRPPLGLAYISQYIKQHNFISEVIDMNIDFYNKSDDNYKRLWNYDYQDCWLNENSLSEILTRFHKDLDYYIENILSSNASIIGFSVHQKNYKFAYNIAKRIKEIDSKKIVVFGGPQCAGIDNRHCLPIFFYENGTHLLIDADIVDIFVIGEGEEAIIDIMQRIRDKKKLIDIPGIIVKDSLGFSGYISRLPPQKLGKISFPKFEDFILDKYTTNSLPIAASRGCPHRCSFCNNHIFIKGYRFRTAENVFEEIKYHYTYNKIINFSFYDLLINANIKQLEHICKLIIDAGYSIGWGAEALIREEMNLELLIKMKRSGCSFINYGIESFANSVLRKMNKNYTAEEACNIIKLTKQAGIKTGINLIAGFPGEGEEEFYETVKAIESNAEFIDQISSLNTCFVLPQTELESHPQNYGIMLPQDSHWLKWETVDGRNTNSVRVKRAKELISILSSKGICLKGADLFDENYIKI